MGVIRDEEACVYQLKGMEGTQGCTLLPYSGMVAGAWGTVGCGTCFQTMGILYSTRAACLDYWPQGSMHTGAAAQRWGADWRRE